MRERVKVGAGGGEIVSEGNFDNGMGDISLHVHVPAPESGGKGGIQSSVTSSKEPGMVFHVVDISMQIRIIVVLGLC